MNDKYIDIKKINNKIYVLLIENNKIIKIITEFDSKYKYKKWIYTEGILSNNFPNQSFFI